MNNERRNYACGICGAPFFEREHIFMATITIRGVYYHVQNYNVRNLYYVRRFIFCTFCDAHIGDFLFMPNNTAVAAIE